jgi:hypothetical protein
MYTQLFSYKGNFKPFALGTILLTTVLVIPATADTIYTYTGNVFVTAPDPYTKAMKVTIQLTYTDPLKGGLTGSNEVPKSFEISDGIQTYTNGYEPKKGVTFFKHFLLWTDADGDIINWDIVAGVGIKNNIGFIRDRSYIDSINTTAAQNETNIARQIDLGQLTTATLPVKLPEGVKIPKGFRFAEATIHDKPGDWVKSTTMPESVPMSPIGTGFPGLLAACAGLLFWWHKRHTSRLDTALALSRFAAPAYQGAAPAARTGPAAVRDDE